MKTLRQGDSIKKELDVIRKLMKEDKQLYYAWQSNIAMSFVDELQNKGYRLPELNEMANNAAKRFLDLLLK